MQALCWPQRGVRGMHVGQELDERLLHKVDKWYPVLGQAVALLDSTRWETARRGLLVGTYGVGWVNGWRSRESRGYAFSWPELQRLDISVRGQRLYFGDLSFFELGECAMPGDRLAEWLRSLVAAFAEAEQAREAQLRREVEERERQEREQQERLAREQEERAQAQRLREEQAREQQRREIEERIRRIQEEMAREQRQRGAQARQRREEEEQARLEQERAYLRRLGQRAGVEQMWRNRQEEEEWLLQRLREEVAETLTRQRQRARQEDDGDYERLEEQFQDLADRVEALAEQLQAQRQRPSLPVGGTAPPQAADGVDVNRASLGELMALPGISAGAAQRVVERRASQPFASLEELSDFLALPPHRAERLRGRVRFGKTPAPPTAEAAPRNGGGRVID